MDASFVSRALIPTQRLVEAQRQLVALVRGSRLILAPYLLQAEFFSAVRRLERRRRIDPQEASKALTAFRLIPFVFAWSDSWVARGMEIARKFDLSTVYDALYLATAEEQGAELYTCDAAFCAALGSQLPPRVKLLRGT